MNKILKIILFANLVIMLLAIYGCSEDGITTPNTPNNNGGSITTTISGIVVNESNEPVQGATVTAYGQVKTSGSNGEFMFTNITVPANRLFVKAEKSGFFTATRGELPKSGATVLKNNNDAKNHNTLHQLNYRRQRRSFQRVES